LGIWGSSWAVNDAGSLDIFKHFKKIFADPEILGKLLNTVRLSCLRLVFGFPIPIIIVVAMNEMRLLKLKKFIQTLIYLPHFVSWVIIAGILQSFTQTGGTFQTAMTAIFGRELYFFSDSDLFIATLIVSDLWKEAGWNTVIYLAAIAGIDPCLEEAAMIDGAGRWQRIVHIILPGISSAVSINLIFACSNLIYGGFDQVFNLYNSAVYAKGDILETYTYRIGISGGQYSLSTALGFFNSSVALILMLIANKIVKKLGGSSLW
jgi:putative aldouronate transport system permease protein